MEHKLIDGQSKMDIKLISCRKDFWEFVRNLRNHKEVKKGFIVQDDITPELHESYMNCYSDCYKICLFRGEPVGFIGSVDSDIRIAVLPEYQNFGIGTWMIREFYSRQPEGHAKIKIENVASLRAFEKAGFKIKYFLLEMDEQEG